MYILEWVYSHTSIITSMQDNTYTLAFCISQRARCEDTNEPGPIMQIEIYGI